MLNAVDLNKMELLSLGTANPSTSGFNILSFGDCRILVNTPLNEDGILSSSPHPFFSSDKDPEFLSVDPFRPSYLFRELGLIDFTSIDCILISNHHSLLALPFITEYTEFNGLVITTEPTIELGKQLIQELLAYSTKGYCTLKKYSNIPAMSKRLKGFTAIYNPFTKVNSSSEIKGKKRNLEDTKMIFYTWEDALSSLGKIKAVRYLEEVTIVPYFHCTAVSAGFCLGSCNWILSHFNNKIAYISSSAMNVSIHPEMIDINSLRNAEVVLFECLKQSPNSFEQNLNEICKHTAATVADGGNAMISCRSTGFVFDIIEVLGTHILRTVGDHIPFYFISPVAKQSLLYSNIVSEWMCKEKQDKSFIPEVSLAHGKMMNDGQLTYFVDVHEFLSEPRKKPCVVFCGHPSLKFGSILDFIMMWKDDSKNSLILTETSLNSLKLLGQLSHFEMTVHCCPLDVRLDISQGMELCDKIQPSTIFLPFTDEIKSKPLSSTPSNGNGISKISYKPLKSIEFHFRPPLARALLSEKLAKVIKVNNFKNWKFAKVNGTAVMEERELIIKGATLDDYHRLRYHGSTCLLGSLGLGQITMLLNDLEKNGLPATLEQNGKVSSIILENGKGRIECSATSVSVHTNDQQCRELLKELILQHFEIL